MKVEFYVAEAGQALEVRSIGAKLSGSKMLARTVWTPLAADADAKTIRVAKLNALRAVVTVQLDDPFNQL